MSPTTEHPRMIDGRIPEHQRRAPAPPLPILHGDISLRFAHPNGEDLSLIHRWMNASHVARFWEQDWPIEQWQAHLTRMYRDTYERPYIAELDGKPIAYVELYRSARDVIAEHYDADAWDLGVHGAIGDPHLIGKNLAFLFWMDVIPAIFRAEPQCQAVLTDPSESHPVAVRLDQWAANHIGGENLGPAQLPHKRAVLFRYSRAGALASGKLLP